MKRYRYHTTNGLTPDIENIRRLTELLNRDSGRTEISLIPTGEGRWKIEGFEFDIEMPTTSWDIGHLILRDGRYRFDPKERGEHTHYAQSHYNRKLDIFYRRIHDQTVPAELLFTGKHEDGWGKGFDPGDTTRPFGDPDNPTLEEIADHVKQVIMHSATVERYLREFDVRINDGQHPHDLMGPGNKLEWEVIQGLALRERKTSEQHRRYEQAIALHRNGQRHHHYWNQKNWGATETDLKYGAIDAIAALREPRDYQGGVRSWEEISALIEQNAEHKRPWMRWAMERIREHDQGGEP